MSRKALLSCVLYFCVALCFAQSAEGGLISGEDWGILVSAPKGWIWDTQAYRPRGVEGIYRKQGEKFSQSALHISIAPFGKAAGGPASLADFLKADKASLLASDPGLAMRELPAYSPGMEYRFELRDVDEPGTGYFLRLAYFEGGRAFFRFVLSCRSPEERDREGGALLELLDSFVYLSKE